MNSITILREEVEVVKSYKYFNIHLNNRMDLKCNTQSVVLAIFFAAICWGSSIRASDTKKLKGGSVLGTAMAPPAVVVESRILHYSTL